MACSDCVKLGIPERLCSEGKQLIPEFDSDELLYRRHNEVIETSPIEVDLEVMNRIFKLQNDSLNRSSLSDAEDVLIDENGLKYPSAGILAIAYKHACHELSYDRNGVETIASLKVVHDIKDCNYAHVEHWCEIAGERKKDGRPPNSTKQLFRRHFLKHAVVIKHKE